MSAAIGRWLVNVGDLVEIRAKHDTPIAFARERATGEQQWLPAIVATLPDPVTGVMRVMREGENFALDRHFMAVRPRPRSPLDSFAARMRSKRAGSC